MTSDNAELKQAILGALMYEGQKAFDICRSSGLAPDHFNGFAPIAHVIWKHAESGKPYGLPEVSDAMRHQKTLDTIGGSTTLNKCVDLAQPTSSLAYECEKLIDAANRKRFELELDQALDDLRDGRSPGEIATRIMANLPVASNAIQDKFPSVTLRDLEDYVSDPADFILGDGWLKRGNGMLFTGGTGLGKSVFTMQLAASVAAGKSFFGMKIAKPFHVLYCQVENDMDCMKRDLLSIVTHLELDKQAVQENLDIRCVYGLHGELLTEWLIPHSKDKDLVLLDPYQCFVAVDDLNSTQAALSWINTINPILRANRFALGLVAHPPKPKDRQAWTDRESVYMAMGSSVLPNWARTSAELTESGKEAPGVFRLRFGKNAERTGLIDECGHIIRDLNLCHSESSQEPYWKLSDYHAPKTKSDTKEEIRKIIAEAPGLSIRRIADLTKTSKSNVDRIIKEITNESNNQPYIE